jgi:hypothetical protein
VAKVIGIVKPELGGVLPSKAEPCGLAGERVQGKGAASPLALPYPRRSPALGEAQASDFASGFFALGLRIDSLRSLIR